MDRKFYHIVLLIIIIGVSIGIPQSIGQNQETIVQQGDNVVYKVTKLDFLNVNVQKITSLEANETIAINVNKINKTGNIISANQTIMTSNGTVKDSDKVNISLMKVGSYFIYADWNYWSSWVGNQTISGANSISYSINRTIFIFTISSGLNSDVYYYRVDSGLLVMSTLFREQNYSLYNLAFIFMEIKLVSSSVRTLDIDGNKIITIQPGNSDGFVSENNTNENVLKFILIYSIPIFLVIILLGKKLIKTKIDN